MIIQSHARLCIALIAMVYTVGIHDSDLLSCTLHGVIVGMNSYKCKCNSIYEKSGRSNIWIYLCVLQYACIRA